MNRPTFVRFAATLTVCAALVAGVLALGGCASAKQKPAAEPAAVATPAFPVTITDDAGRKVTITAEPKTIVSLAPSNTEILFAIGAGDRVVGVTSYDDYPAEVADIAKVGDFAGPNMEKITSLDPSIVFATTGVQEDAIKQLEDLGATVVVVDPTTLDKLSADIINIGKAVGCEKQAQTVVADMKSKIEAIAAQAPADEASRPTVFLEIGQNPLFTVGKGTLINELLEVAGAKNVVTESGYVPYSSEQVLAASPAMYFATSGMGSTPEEIAKRPGYSKLDAVKKGNVVVLEENLISRPGPRIVEGLASIQAALAAIK